MAELVIAPPEKIPSHVAIIMDGNGRWALSRGRPRLDGHRAGVENLRRIITACVEFGIKYLTIYICSMKDLNSSEDDVKQLMYLLESMIDQELDELHRNGVQLRHIGQLDGINPSLQAKMNQAISLTKYNNRLVLNLAINYSGRDEIVQAIRMIIANDIAPSNIDEKIIRRYLSINDQPDPELIIHTNGEMRVGDFLIWQGTYAEDYVTPVFWPDFDKDELYEAIQYFAKRDRRFGVLPQSKK